MARATYDSGNPDAGGARALKANGKEAAGHKLEAKDEKEPAEAK